MSSETDKQITKELGQMYSKMRDPVRQEQKLLKDNIKKNVERKKQRAGL